MADPVSGSTPSPVTVPVYETKTVHERGTDNSYEVTKKYDVVCNATTTYSSADVAGRCVAALNAVEQKYAVRVLTGFFSDSYQIVDTTPLTPEQIAANEKAKQEQLQAAILRSAPGHAQDFR